MRKSLVNQLRNNLSRWERIRIIDRIVLNDERDPSLGAVSFYKYWYQSQGREIDSSSYENFEHRKRPNYADFALGYLKMLCEKNDMEFKNADFSEDNYINENDICLFKQNSKRTIDDDLSVLRYHLSKSGDQDELTINISSDYGYKYEQNLGLSLDNIERQTLQTIKEQTNIVLDKLRQLKITRYDMAPVIKELDSVLGTTPKVKDISNMISYDRDNSMDNTKFFNKLFEFINNKKLCLMSWETNKAELNQSVPIVPLYLKQHNNRWYILYVRQEHFTSLDNFKTLEHFEELCLDHFDITPLDQIKNLDDHPNELKQPKYLEEMGKKYFGYVFGTGRPRIYDKDPEATRSIYPEKVLFRISKTDPKAKFLRFRLQPKGPSSIELQAELFPNMRINKKKSNEEFLYYDAEFYVAQDAINRILSYLPLIEVVEGEQTKAAIRERVSQYNIRASVKNI